MAKFNSLLDSTPYSQKLAKNSRPITAKSKQTYVRNKLSGKWNDIFKTTKYYSSNTSKAALEKSKFIDLNLFQGLNYKKIVSISNSNKCTNK